MVKKTNQGGEMKPIIQQLNAFYNLSEIDAPDRTLVSFVINKLSSINIQVVNFPKVSSDFGEIGFAFKKVLIEFADINLVHITRFKEDNKFEVEQIAINTPSGWNKFKQLFIECLTQKEN
jgi:hypothetical protein